MVIINEVLIYHRVQRNIWGVSDAPTGVSVFRRFNIGRGNFIPTFSKKETLFGKIYYCTAGTIKVSYTTDKVDVRLPVFANTSMQYQNLAQKQNITLFTLRSYNPELITKQIMVR
jgi:hypothetical protein